MMRDISYAWTSQAVDTIQVVCLALDALVKERMKELQAVLDARAEA